MTGWNFGPLNRKALVALILFFLTGFFAVVSADTSTSYEKMVGSLVNLMTRTNTADAVVLPEEVKVRIRGLIEEVKAGRLNFECVDAFNDYNFCELSNKILGDLYKSHGCLHVSPVNVRILNEILPIGSVVEIKPYTADYD
ncbi:hypothetical protein A2276_02005 [candidate division WOR-1 bacterium RIFOXYA12_FULL_43_27]|uniref:Uncharacterized protein n=1 Tax=candidate division WOR-1 bacterium RIFOXYC2_FULL_46_14 TaxID=1802587 RepID=A0A1F4U6W5_UNCSA|nr:MAG: hypothetical protein A2276_02005 [candidate division WOR-1 bacterium RIFOXYA12_FULL_43_27]OGC19504.1 MAG: hypothetical protein A2292_02325 [candidate division WOR-1 bacterium RIFOXYB2_FULL_46_45]OGC30492.1 MAG: hypothetical protein A2232_02325 [candidate division WOR-1 bacterium RIFOXYA2_FULL_46_56]OGC40560.1 MAG: hypothetical protein A2438_06040 [candidate division WOR-1 bacterium RIFOXYC2_FULL_46_14]